MDLLDLIQQKRFLGAEFLTWLWFKSEQGGGVVEVPGQESVTLWLDDRLELASLDPGDQKSVLRGGSPSTSPEARVALKEERKAAAAKLRLAKGEREWAFTLDGQNLDLKAVKIPALLTSEEDDKFFERVHLMEELKSVVEGVFGRFIEIRTGPEWDSERLALSQWIASDGKSATQS